MGLTPRPSRPSADPPSPTRGEGIQTESPRLHCLLPLWEKVPEGPMRGTAPRTEVPDARLCDHVGMAVVCRAMDACHHGHCLDRIVILFHRARPRPAQDAEPAATGAWRGVAGAWGWILPHPEIPRGAGLPARASHLVQMGELC